MNLNQNLKPCPFCGGRAVIHLGDQCVWVACEQCGCRTLARAEKEHPYGAVDAGRSIEAVENVWNRRVETEGRK